jgi:hypothetical protein
MLAFLIRFVKDEVIISVTSLELAASSIALIIPSAINLLVLLILLRYLMYSSLSDYFNGMPPYIL